VKDQELIERSMQGEIIGGGLKQVPLLCERIRRLDRVMRAATNYRFAGNAGSHYWLKHRGWQQTTNRLHWYHDSLRPVSDPCSDTVALAIELEQALIELDK
jgi:hypothetical protein